MCSGGAVLHDGSHAFPISNAMHLTNQTPRHRNCFGASLGQPQASGFCYSGISLAKFRTACFNNTTKPRPSLALFRPGKRILGSLSTSQEPRLDGRVSCVKQAHSALWSPPSRPTPSALQPLHFFLPPASSARRGVASAATHHLQPLAFDFLHLTSSWQAQQHCPKCVAIAHMLSATIWQQRPACVRAPCERTVWHAAASLCLGAL